MKRGGDGVRTYAMNDGPVRQQMLAVEIPANNEGRLVTVSLRERSLAPATLPSPTRAERMAASDEPILLGL